MDINPN